jgi:hypothetical protein
MREMKNIMTNVPVALIIALLIAVASYLFLTIAMVPILWFTSSNPSEAINFVLVTAFPAVSWLVFVATFAFVMLNSDW